MLSPWEEMAYFDQPIFSAVTMTQNVATRIVKANPQRVGIILSVAGGAGLFVGPDSTTALTKGIQLTTTFPYILFDQKTWGVLVQGEWWGFTNTPSINATIIELVLREWPSRGDRPNEPT